MSVFGGVNGLRGELGRLGVAGGKRPPLAFSWKITPKWLFLGQDAPGGTFQGKLGWVRLFQGKSALRGLSQGKSGWVRLFLGSCLRNRHAWGELLERGLVLELDEVGAQDNTPPRRLCTQLLAALHYRNDELSTGEEV